LNVNCKIRLTILDDLTRNEGDNENPVIEVLDSKLTATESSQEVNLYRGNKVVVLSLESIVRLLLNDDNDVAWLCAWRLIALAVEGDGLAALHPLVDMYLQDLLLGDDLLALAVGTPIFGVDDLPSP
jgi:hypothetical protein